jgi:sulfate adenylyltransferase subunit 1 (EFTu-like GTPase family)
MLTAPVSTDRFEQFLQRDMEKDLLRFTTAGSVDDGKSTLIGRLLHDAKAVCEDQLPSVKKAASTVPAGRLISRC